MKMPSPESRSGGQLREIQRDFAQAVMRPLDPDQGMQREWLDGRPALEMASAFIKPNDRLDALERLEIYNRQYWFRLLNSLHEDFPALRAVLGEESFYDLSVAYLEKNPSRSFTLRDLGDRLEIFLKQEPRWVALRQKMARDVVRLEWAHIVAFDAAERPPLELDELLGRDPADLRLSFQPHVTFLACDYAVDQFVLRIRKQEFPAAETSNAVSEPVRTPSAAPVELPPAEKIWLAVHRSGNSVYYKRLEREAYLICTALQKGRTLPAACEKAFARREPDEKFPALLQAWFAQWAAFGWLCRHEDAQVSELPQP